MFTAGEQEFYASRGLMHPPGRCPACRAARKARLGTESATVAVETGSYRRERPQREMHPAVCSNCGRETMVPFVPRGDKPVYCSSCFEQVRSYR